MWKMMIKVKGTLNTVYNNEEGDLIQPSQTKYFKRYGLRCKLFIFKMRIFYDYVEISEY